MTKTPIQKLSHDEIAGAIMLLKHRAGELGLFKTMHAMEPATKAVGYELAERIEGLTGKGKADRHSRRDFWKKHGGRLSRAR